MFLAAAVADGSFQETHSGSSFLKDFGQIGKIIVVNNNQPFCRQGGNLYGFAAVKPVDFVVAGRIGQQFHIHIGGQLSKIVNDKNRTMCRNKNRPVQNKVQIFVITQKTVSETLQFGNRVNVRKADVVSVQLPFERIEERFGCNDAETVFGIGVKSL